MTEFDYNNLSITKSSFTNTGELMKGGKYESNDLACLTFAIILVEKYGVNGAIAYTERYEEWQEHAIIKAHQLSTL